MDASGRIGAFLSYVISEEIQGRGDAIRGKTIAQDVYDRAPQDHGDADNVVRVDARRLRQTLDHYYATQGDDDPVRIHMDPGSYCPSYEVVNPVQDPAETRPRTPYLAYGALFGLGAIVGGAAMLGLSFAMPQQNAPVVVAAFPGAGVPERTFSMAERSAILQKSPAMLEAITLAEQGHRMIFPVFDAPRQVLLASIFQRVIELGPDFYGGYAGLAHVLSIRALVTADAEARTAFLTQAQSAADQALRLAPAEARTQMAQALAVFAAGDREEALRLAELSVELAPMDGQLSDFLGTIALFSGQNERAVAASENEALRESGSQRFANRNIFAAASFHLGNYRDTTRAFNEAAALGDPICALSFAYHVAALQALGDIKAAERKLQQLEQSWPDASIANSLFGIHGDTAPAEDVLQRLRDAGWRDG
ncbi:MAG: hypothetical protein GJ676_10600 [Rhodobacteraceae bacterium]|nr:hypothetical protein [Paracoccaceae bacterium]